MYFCSHIDDAAPFVERWLLTVGKHLPVLDVGCGGGHDPRRYAGLGYDNPFGIDPANARLREARSRLAEHAKIRRGNMAGDMKYPTAFILQIIAIFGCIIWWDSPIRHTGKQAALKSGGLFVFVASNPIFDAASRHRVVVDGRCVFERDRLRQ